MVRKKPAAPMRSTPRRKAKEVAKAEAFIDKQFDAIKEDAVKKTRAKRKEPWQHVTKEQILHAREQERLSWRDVALKLELGSPSTARKAYTALTGRPHNESEVLVKRAPRGTSHAITGQRQAVITRPEWDDWTLDEDLENAIRGRILIVARNGREEEIRVSSGMEEVGRQMNGKKRQTIYKDVKVLHHGIRTRNSKGERLPPFFCFTEAQTTNARTVTVDEIIAVR